MSDSFGEDLLKLLQEGFRKDFKASSRVKAYNRALEEGKATYEDANGLAGEIGDILAKQYKKFLKGEDFPDGLMGEDLARAVVEPTLKDNYRLVSAFCHDVQEGLNRKAGLGLRSLTPAFNQSRADGIVKRLSEDAFDEVKRILDEPVVNFSQSIVDDCIRENAEFHYKLGLRAKVVRKEVGSCCDRCKEVAGEYEYPDVPKDVYRRHRFCRCSVEYFPGNGKKQDVWSKKWVDINKEDKIERRKRANLKPDFKPVSDKQAEAYQAQSDKIYKKFRKNDSCKKAVKSIDGYTQGDYVPINDYLSSGEKDDYMEKTVGGIDKIMGDFKLKDDIIVYKGTNIDHYNGKLVGDVIDSKIYFSTSIDKETAEGFYNDYEYYSDDGKPRGLFFEIRVPKGTEAIYIGSNTAYDNSEYEMLLSRKLRYRVVEKKDEKHRVLEVLNENH